MADLFDQSDKDFLRSHGWHEGGGTQHGSLLWRDPVTNGHFTLDEALKLERRREEQREWQRKGSGSTAT